jgi:hypothetical protein
MTEELTVLVPARTSTTVSSPGCKPVVLPGDGVREFIKGYRMVRDTVHGNA